MISDRYKELRQRHANRTAWGEDFPAAATQDIVDATDETGDGGLQDALESLRRGVRIANGEKADDAADDEKKDEFTSLANAVAVRRLARLAAQVPQDPAADEKRAKVAKDAAAFVIDCHRKAGWLK